MFVSFEGLDGSGKTTQVERLRAPRGGGREVVTAREPGGTELGEQIRTLVLHGGEMTPWAEALLSCSRPRGARRRGDRRRSRAAPTSSSTATFDSSVVYQGIGRGLGRDEVLQLNLLAVGGVVPDRTFVLAVDADRSLGRVGERPDRIEREDAGFHERVAAATRSWRSFSRARRRPRRPLDPDALAARDL